MLAVQIMSVLKIYSEEYKEKAKERCRFEEAERLRLRTLTFKMSICLDK
jgi:hypothetical protein